MGGAGKETQLGDAWVMKLGTVDVSWAPLPGACPTPARAWHSAHMLQTDQVCLLGICPYAAKGLNLLAACVCTCM